MSSLPTTRKAGYTLVTVATIRKHRGKFQAIIRRKGFPPKAKSFTRRADAVAWAAIVESEMERGEFVDRSEADRTLLGPALKRYAEEVTPRKKGAKQEVVRLRYWQKHRLARTALSKLKPLDFSEWRDAELKAGKSPNTVRNHLTILSHFFNHVRREWGIPIRNPISDLWRPKPRRRSRRFRDGEEGKLLEAAPKVHANLPQAIIVLTETAMRRGDLMAMAKPRMDLSRRVYTFPPGETKNDESRHVPLSQRAVEALESLPTRIDGRVWPWLNKDTLSKLFKEACDLAGIEDFHLHDLRHEATSRLAKIFEAQQLAKIRGDKTLNELMTYYHPTADELAERLDRAAPPAPSSPAKRRR